MRTFAVIGCALLVAAGCSSGSGGAGGGGTAAAAAPRPASGSSTLITQEEIARGQYATALDIVENLRPSMMRPRASTLSNTTSSSGLSYDAATSVSVVVFADEVRMGDLRTLSNIPATTVQEIRYINSRDATTRWGTGYGSGVIQVITKKR